MPKDAPQYQEPTGQLQDLVVKPKNNGKGFDLIALDEKNVPWIWSWHDGRWTANMHPDAGDKLGYLTNREGIFAEQGRGQA